MAKGDRLQCSATTKSGNRCSRKAYKNESLCGLHGGKGRRRPPKKKAASQARASRITVDDTDSFSPSLKEILEVCRAEEANPSDNSTKVQWVQIHLKVVVAALERQDRLDGIGVGAEYKFTLVPPAETKPVITGDTEIVENRKDAN